ncbi:MAG: hypothetical protein V2B15_08595 [Bacteroidota bacterium]
MLSDNYKKGLSFIDHSAEVLEDTAEKLFHQQQGILSTYYNRRTGTLQAHLQSRPFNVHKSSSGVNLIIDYLTQIRFMDLKKTATGKKKRIYEPIYNKPLYGFLFGYAYHRLRLGLLEYLRQNTTARVNTIHIEIPT